MGDYVGPFTAPETSRRPYERPIPKPEAQADDDEEQQIFKVNLIDDDVDDLPFVKDVDITIKPSEPSAASTSTTPTSTTRPSLTSSNSAIEPGDTVISDITLPTHLLTLPNDELTVWIKAHDSKSNEYLIAEFNENIMKAIAPYTTLLYLRWKPKHDQLEEKILGSRTHDYLQRTCILGNYLSGILDELLRQCEGFTKFLIVDLLNIMRQVVRLFFGDIWDRENRIQNRSIYEYVLNIISDFLDIMLPPSSDIWSRGARIKIILCVQNHLLNDQYFEEFVKKLLRRRGIFIYILPGHNRSSGDDVLGLLAYVLLNWQNPRGKIKFLTYDGFLDFESSSFKPREFLSKFANYINNPETKRQLYRKVKLWQTENWYAGGTIKYKKSLATKRSRKVYKKTYKKTYKKKKTIKRKIKRKL